MGFRRVWVIFVGFFSKGRGRFSILGGEFGLVVVFVWIVEY